MNKLSFKAAWLVTKLKENRDQHREQYVAAFEGYQKEAISALEDNIERIRNGSQQRVFFTETPPEDHTKDYNRAIMMLENAIDENVELSDHEFRNYVMDDWDWKDGWAASNSKYLSA